MAITLTRNALDWEENQAGQHVWPLLVSATSDDGLTANIFVYHVQPDPEVDSIFSCVASLPQLSEIGLTPSTNTPFFRQDTLRFDCRSPEEAQELWTLVEQDVRDLVWNYQWAEGLDIDEAVVIS